MHPAKDIECGRRFIRVSLAKLLVECCGRNAYSESNDGEEEEEEAERSKRFPFLYTYDRQSWEQLELSLKKVRSLLQRKDATVSYSGNAADTRKVNDSNNCDPDPGRIRLPVLGKRFDAVIRMIEIHKAVSPIRQRLEDQIAANSFDFSSAIEQDKINEILYVPLIHASALTTTLSEVWSNSPPLFLRVFIETVDDEQTQKTVKSLFREEKKQSPEPTSGAEETLYSLVDGKSTARILRSNMFDLNCFQDKVEHIIQEMNGEIFSNYLSILVQLRYTIETGSTMDQTLRASLKTRRHMTSGKVKMDELRRHRVALGAEHGDDPLPEALRVSEQHTAARKRKASDKRPDAPPGKDADIYEDQDPSPAKRSRVRSSRLGAGEAAALVPPDPGLFDERGKVTRRTAWTEDEKNCVKLGVERFGVGSWMTIKEEYSDVLRNRTNVQIKDCWRTMVKKNKVTSPEAADAAPVPATPSVRPTAQAGASEDSTRKEASDGGIKEMMGEDRQEEAGGNERSNDGRSVGRTTELCRSTWV